MSLFSETKLKLRRRSVIVENYRCWSRVIIRSEMTKAEADECQRVIENQTLSETVDGFRDCQKWVVECLGPLGFIQGEVNLWDGLKAKNIWEIECTINDLGVKYFGLSFVRGPAYVDKDKAIRMGFGGLDEDKNAKSIIQAELNRLQELLDDNIATQVSFLAQFSIEQSQLVHDADAIFT